MFAKRILVALVAVVVGLACGVARSAGTLDVPITLTETAGVARSAEPVSVGVPVARGVLKDASQLCVIDPKGNKVPAQFDVLMKWWKTDKFADSDGTVRWVLVDFQADVPANGKATYRLADTGPGPEHATPVKVGPVTRVAIAMNEYYKGACEITTGPVCLFAYRGGLMGWLLAQKHADHEFDTDEDLVAVDGMDGKRYGSHKDAADPPKMTGSDYQGMDFYLKGFAHNPGSKADIRIEKQGPLHTVVMLEGVMKAQSAGGEHEFTSFDAAGNKAAVVKIPNRDEQIGFRMRIHAYAGKPYVRVFFTTINLRGKSHTATDQERYRSGAYIADTAKVPGNLLIESLELGTKLDAKGPVTYQFGGDTVQSGKLDAKDKLTMYQDSSAGWIWQVAEKKIYDPVLKSQIDWCQKNPAFFKEFDAVKQPYHEYSDIHYKILTGQDGCSFMGYRLLDKDGKKVGEGNRSAGWVDVSDGKVGMTTAVRWFWQMYPKSIRVEGDGRVVVGILPKEWGRGHFLDGKTHRTDELLYRFHGVEEAGAAETAVKAFNTPLVAYCGLDTYLNSGACGLFARPDEKSWPLYEAQQKTAVHVGVNPKVPPAFDSSYEVEREKDDAYGWQHFGDTSKRGFRGHSQFEEFDSSRCLLMHFYHTGDPAFFIEAEKLDRFLMNIPCLGGGYGHQHPESSHNWIQGLIDYWCLTGLPEAKEGIDAMQGYYRSCQNEGAGNWHFNGRNAAYALNGLRQFYEFTGDSVWAKAANTCIRSVKDRTRPVSGYFGGNPADFMQHVLCHAAGRFALLTGDEDAVDLLLGLSGYFKPFSGQGGGIDTADCYAYATMLTGDRTYLDTAIKNNKDAGCVDEAGPHYRTGTASSKTWSGGVGGYGQIFFYAVREWKPADTNPPAPVTDLAAEPGDKPGTVKLTWTNTGDDGVKGRAAKVQVKYATGEIVELIPWGRNKMDATVAPEWNGKVNFWYAQNAVGEPEPGEPGAKQTWTLSGLPAGKTVWIAMKVHDESMNRSKISNVVSVKAP